MGYGFGGFLVVVGLVLALAVQDRIEAVDLTMVGWIMTGVGVVLLLLAALTAMRGGRARSATTVTHADGSQSIRETRTDI